MSLTVYLSLDVDVGRTKPHHVEFFSANVTHNLTAMADEAGIYRHLWHPEQVDVVTASDLIEPLSEGLNWLRSEPERFKKLNPKNGWGDYQGFVQFVVAYLEACEAFPKANVEVCG